MVSLILLSSCKFSRMLKNPDIEEKYEAALKLYNEKDYSRALQLFDQMVGAIRATDKAEDLYYFYAYCYYHQSDYTLASYYFKRFYTSFPNTARAEECLFMSAYCNYKNSPEPPLDQTSTYDAIKELQLFMNIFPKSKRVPECNELIDKMREKLENKDYRIAKLYFRMGDYAAAITCFNNIVKDFPETLHKEDILFLVVKSYHKYAMMSIFDKRNERHRKAISAYEELMEEFPESKYIPEAKLFVEKSQKELGRLISYDNLKLN
jgi:outer membrane protein assembly factor BamD